MTPLSSTLADLTALKLVQYAHDNMPVVPPVNVKPVNDPMAGNAQLKALNLTQQEGFVYGGGADVTSTGVVTHGGGIDGTINGLNPAMLAHFDYQARTWESSGKDATQIPPFPQFKVVDLAAFDQWWASFNANLMAGISNAPPMTFVKNADPLPTVVILPPNMAATVPFATDGPVGAPMPGQPGYFYSAGATVDTYPDSYIYAGSTGVYQKHIAFNPFTGTGFRIYWYCMYGTAQMAQPAPILTLPKQ